MKYKTLQPKKKISWLYVIFASILFLPLGIYVLSVKINTEPEDRIKNGKTVLWTGALITIVSAVFTALRIAGTAHDGMPLIVRIFPPGWFLLVGLLLLLYGAMPYRRGLQNKKLRQLLYEGITDIDDLSLLVNCSPEQCAYLISRLDSERQLPGAVVNIPGRTVALAGGDDPDVSRYIERLALAEKTPGKPDTPKDKAIKYLINSLWILSAFLGITGAYSFPFVLLFAAAALILQLKLRPEENPVILYSGIFILFISMFMLGTVGNYALQNDYTGSESLLFLKLYLPGILFFFFYMAIWQLICRKARKIQFSVSE